MAPLIAPFRSDPSQFLTIGIRGAPAPFAPSTAGEPFLDQPNIQFDTQATISMDGSELSFQNSDPIKVTQPKLSRFNGEDVEGWLSRCSSYFLLNLTAVEHRVPVASLYLEGEARRWCYRTFKTLIGVSWETFEEALIERFAWQAEPDLEKEVSSKCSVKRISDCAPAVKIPYPVMELKCDSGDGQVRASVQYLGFLKPFDSGGAAITEESPKVEVEKEPLETQDSFEVQVDGTILEIKNANYIQYAYELIDDELWIHDVSKRKSNFIESGAVLFRINGEGVLAVKSVHSIVVQLATRFNNKKKMKAASVCAGTAIEFEFFFRIVFDPGGHELEVSSFQSVRTRIFKGTGMSGLQ